MRSPVEHAMPRHRDLHCPPLPRVALRVQRLLLIAGLGLTDTIALVLAFRFSYWVRFGLQLTLAPEVTPSPGAYQALSAGLVPLFLGAFAAFRLYDRHAKLGGVTESSRLFNACTTSTMLVVLGTFFVPTFVVSRVWLVSVWLTAFVFVAISRFLARRVVYALRTRGYLVSPAVIVGTNEEALSLAAFLADWRSSGIATVGLVSTNANGIPERVGWPVLGATRDIAAIVEEHRVEDVIVAITSLGREELLALCEDLDPLPVELRLSSGLYELLTTRVAVRTFGTVPLMSIQKSRLDRGEAVVKTLLEGSLAALGVLVTLPLMLAIAAVIKVDSRGPVIHRRRVLGVSQRQFDAFKFRTMYLDGEARLRERPEAVRALRANHKLKDDPRVTRVGRWLRKFSLDELPQLFNVLAGQMSLVGPRMITPEEAEKYGRHRLNLLTVKPGITGLWQVSGRSDLSYEERVRIDMYYVRNYSIWMDLQILFVETLPAVLKGRGAY
jgi:exopolysaccharide biosynthesis polyprenyl glycosylphosphotransferase